MERITNLKDLRKVKDILNESVLDTKEEDTLDNQLTTEVLDEIAKQFRPKPKTDRAFQEALLSRCLSIVDLFGDDEKEAIIQAKLADQLCRMFEKMRDNCLEAGQRLKAERKIKERQNVGIELTIQPVEDIDKKIEGMRYQYAILDRCFRILVTHLRPKVKAITGIDFGQYTNLKDMPKVRRLQNKRSKQTLDALLNDPELLTEDTGFMRASNKQYKLEPFPSEEVRDLYLDLSNQEGIVEIPEDLQ